MPRWQVAVAGAGPAGSALALALARSGRSVVLLEASRFDRPRIGETLAPDVQPLLRRLGVWPAFGLLAPVPSWGVRSHWGSRNAAIQTHFGHPAGPGWHVDRRAVDQLLATAAAEAGAELLIGRRVAGVTFRGDGWRLATADGGDVEADVVVDATGRRTVLARQLRAQRVVFDRLVGVARSFAGSDGLAGPLEIEAAPDGWWYTAPTPRGGLITVLLTDADLCRAGRLSRPDVWRSRLELTGPTADRVRRLEPTSACAVHPAHSVRHLRSDRRPWLAVGDAALAVDPLTGSGVVRALRMARAAEDVVSAWLDGPDPGGAAARYERERDAECTEFLRERVRHYVPDGFAQSPFWSRRRQVAAAVATAS